MIPNPASVTTIAARIGVSGAIMAALGTGLVVQTVRLEGAKFWPVSIEGAKPRADRLEAALEEQAREYRAAQAQAAERAQAARMAEQRRLSDIARNADNALEQARRDALADAREFIRANRVPAPGGIRSSGPTTTSGNSDTAGALPTDPATIVDATEYVIVPAADVLICTTNTVALESAQAWAAQLNEPAP